MDDAEIFTFKETILDLEDEIARLKAINAELLEACKLGLAIIEMDWEDDKPSASGNILRAAIARAKG